MHKFNQTMKLVELNLDVLKEEILALYESGSQNYKTIQLLKKNTEFLLNSVTPQTEEQELIHSELQYELREIMYDFNDIYYALN
jgi:hypothetical protein